MAKRRIAILMHEADDEQTLAAFLITELAEHWREDGHQVEFLFGTKRFVPADLIFVHVDLSVVPDNYLAFAGRYPIAVNGCVKDIRKSIYSQGLLESGDAWDGPVIVKSNRNFAGAPERARSGFLGKVRQQLLHEMNRLNLALLIPSLRTPLDYRVYPHLREVPSLYFYHPGLIVQKFMPEMEGGMYCVRLMSFLGDRVTCTRLRGKHPIVNGKTTEVVDHEIELHPEMLAMRDRLKFDYGKFDYVVVDGRAILLDANKTVGCSQNLLGNDEMRVRRRYRAEGLYSYFKD